MLNCEQCDYLKKISYEGKEEKFVCEFTQFVFSSNNQFYNMNNHPCNNYQYDEVQFSNYLSRYYFSPISNAITKEI